MGDDAVALHVLEKKCTLLKRLEACNTIRDIPDLNFNISSSILLFKTGVLRICLFACISSVDGDPTIGPVIKNTTVIFLFTTNVHVVTTHFNTKLRATVYKTKFVIISRTNIHCHRTTNINVGKHYFYRLPVILFRGGGVSQHAMGQGSVYPSMQLGRGGVCNRGV